MPHELIRHTLAVVILKGDNIIFQMCSSSPWKVIGKLEELGHKGQILYRKE